MYSFCKRVQLMAATNGKQQPAFLPVRSGSPATRFRSAHLLCACLAFIAPAPTAIRAGDAPQPKPVHVLIQTDKGDIKVELYVAKAPITTANFLRYVDGKFYDGGRFHRTVRQDNQPDNTVKIEVVQAGINPD